MLKIRKDLIKKLDDYLKNEKYYADIVSYKNGNYEIVYNNDNKTIFHLYYGTIIFVIYLKNKTFKNDVCGTYWLKFRLTKAQINYLTKYYEELNYVAK